MENNQWAAALRDAAPTAGAVGAALYAYQKKSSVPWAVGAAFVGYLAVNYLRQKLFAILLDPPVDLPITPVELQAPQNSQAVPLEPGTIEVQDHAGNVLSIEQHKAAKSGGSNGELRP